MSRLIVAFCLLLTTHEAIAACATTGSRAACSTPNGAVGVGPNGAASYNKNTGQVRTAQPSTQSNQVKPGASVQGQRGNSATKAVQPGCAYVNGKRVCN
jgi:hypothetical protein